MLCDVPAFAAAAIIYGRGLRPSSESMSPTRIGTTGTAASFFSTQGPWTFWTHGTRTLGRSSMILDGRRATRGHWSQPSGSLGFRISRLSRPNTTTLSMECEAWQILSELQRARPLIVWIQPTHSTRPHLRFAPAFCISSMDVGGSGVGVTGMRRRPSWRNPKVSPLSSFLSSLAVSSIAQGELWRSERLRNREQLVQMLRKVKNRHAYCGEL